MDRQNLETWLQSVKNVYARLRPKQKSHVLHSLADVSHTDMRHFVVNYVVRCHGEMKRDFVALLPAELVDHLLLYLDWRTCLNACCVSKTWLKKISGNNRLWKRLCRQNGIEISLEVTIDDVLSNFVRSATGSDNGDVESKADSMQALNAGGAAHADELHRRLESFSLEDERTWSDCDVGELTCSTAYKSIFVHRLRLLYRLCTHADMTSCVILEGHTARITSICYHNGLIATGSDDHTVRIWNTREPTISCKRVFNVEHSVSAVKIDDKILAAGSFNASITIWDMESGSRLHHLLAHVQAVFCIDFSVALNLLVSGSADSYIILWSLSSGEPLKSVAVSCVPYTVSFLEIVNAETRAASQQYALAIGNTHRLLIKTFQKSSNDAIDTFIWRQSDSAVLTVRQISNSLFTVAEISSRSTRVEPSHSSPNMVIEWVEIQEKKLAGCSAFAELTTGTATDWIRHPQVCGSIVRRCDAYGMGSVDNVLLGSGSAFSVCVSGADRNIVVLRHPAGRSYAKQICSTKIPSSVQWLTGRGPVATACDSQWLNGFSEHIYAQILAAVALMDFKLAVVVMA